MDEAAAARDQVRATVERLRAGYRERMQAQVGEIAALSEAAGGGGDEAARRALLRQAHRLSGTAGTFGFAGVSQAAGELERALEAALDPGLEGRAGAPADLDSLCRALLDQLAVAIGGPAAAP